MGSDLTPEDRQHALVQHQNRKEIQKQKDRAVIPALEAIATELEARAKSGDLARELAGMKASSIIGNLTRILASIKESAPPVVILNKGTADQDETWLRANSVVNKTPEERERMRRVIETQKEP